MELKPLHRLIKEKFLEITNDAFSPIPTNREFYYCRNLSFEKTNLKTDSDDEISNPPSEIVEFKSDKEVSVSSELQSNYFNLDAKSTEELMNNNIMPLFLHFICTLRCNNNVLNTSVKVLPTCLGELVQYIDPSITNLDKEKLQVTLDILCLTLPTNVQNVITDYSNKGLRTTSFCSDGFQPSIGSAVSETSINSE